MKQKNTVSYLYEVKHSVLIKKKLLDSQFQFTWVQRKHFCFISCLQSLSQRKTEISLHHLSEAELRKSAEDAEWKVDPNHWAKLEDKMLFLLCWCCVTCFLMWTFHCCSKIAIHFFPIWFSYAYWFFEKIKKTQQTRNKKNQQPKHQTPQIHPKQNPKNKQNTKTHLTGFPKCFVQLWLWPEKGIGICSIFY